MLAKGEEPERRPFLPWHALRQTLARARLARWVRWPRRDDFRVPQPVLKLWQKLPPAPAWLAAFFTWFAKTHNRNMQIIGGWIADVLPKGLYARALIIIIAPIVVLEGVVAFVFMERHWQAVTRRLSEATARDIAAVIDIYEDYPK
jgi:two-component system osmolarity sensor histidine kinase EnvZ